MQRLGLLQFRSIVYAPQINYDGIYDKGTCSVWIHSTYFLKKKHLKKLNILVF